MPSTLGVKPRSLFSIAFRIAGNDAFVPRGDQQRARIGRRNAGDLFERNRLAVRFDDEPVQQRGRRAAGANRRKLAARRFDALLHSATSISLKYASVMLTSSSQRRGASRPADVRADRLAPNDAPDVSGNRHVENDDRQARCPCTAPSTSNPSLPGRAAVLPCTRAARSASHADLSSDRRV